MADISIVLLTQLAARDALISGLRTDLTTVQSNIVDLKTNHTTLAATVSGQVDLTTKQGATLGQATKDIAGLKSMQGDLSNVMSTLRNDVTSAHGQLQPLIGRVEQMALDLVRQDAAIHQITRGAATANNPTEVVIVEERNPLPARSTGTHTGDQSSGRTNRS